MSSARNQIWRKRFNMCRYCFNILLFFTLLSLFVLISLIFGIIVFRSPEWAEWYYQSIFLPLNKSWQKLLGFTDAPYYLVMIVLIFILIMGQWMLARGQNWRSALIS